MSSSSTYGRRKPQIQKQDLYMMTALWMEQSPWAMKRTDEQEVVGAVFVRPNDRVLSVDCSRSNEGGSVHGAIRALIKFPDNMIEGCQVYLSRHPCAHCVKMLVQAKVTKVFYLPLKPEKDEKEENKSVDALFKVSSVSREVYVPHIPERDYKELDENINKNPYGFRDLEDDERILSTVQWNEEWKKQVVDVLCWDEYSDDEIKKQVDDDMWKSFEWFDLGVLATGKTKDMKWKEVREQAGTSAEVGPKKAKRQRKNYDEVQVVPKAASHLSRLAQMLSYRTDDPNTGVGCVITLDDEEEIVSIGWNGFPSKALYGNHPRGSDSSHLGSQGKKYPHVIHAEQNALMCRNRRDLGGTTVYVNRIPCNECLPMLCEAGVKKVVLPHFEDKKKPSEKMFFELLDNEQRKLVIFKKE